MTFRPNYFGGPPGQFDVERDEYGKDLVHNGMLEVAPHGDWATVDGVENYRRALIRRCIVRPGEYQRRPGYGAGLASYVKRTLTSSIRAEMESAVAAQVKRDRRTKKVISVAVTAEEFGGVQYIKVVIVVEALGARLALRPFMLSREV
jgi:phage baseplate assembly protein W